MKMYLVLGKYRHTKIGIDNLHKQLKVLNGLIPLQKKKVNEELETYNDQIDRQIELVEMIESIEDIVD